MRTTLTIEDRIARALKQLAHRSGKTLKTVVNETLEAGLAVGEQKEKPGRYRLQPRALGRVLQGINLDKALDVADSLEDEEIGGKMDQRK